MEFIKNFFREGTQESHMRLICFIVAINGCAVIHRGLSSGKITECGTIGLGMISLALGAKYLQKGKEALPNEEK